GRTHLGAFHAGDHGRGDLALGHLIVKAFQPGRGPRAVYDERRFEDRGLLNGRKGEGGLERDDRARADPEDIVGTRFGEERVEIFNRLPHDGARTVGTAESTATAVGQIDGERVSQRLGKLQVALGRLHGTVQHDQARTCAELAIADGGAVFRGYG